MSTDTSSAPLDVDLTQIYNYFQYLSPHDFENEIFTFSFLDFHSKNVVPQFATLHAKLSELLSTLESLPPHSYTLHHTLNRMNVTRSTRKNADVQAVRCICVDLDEPCSREHLKEIVQTENVGMVVESSPSKYHLYWRLAPDMRLDLAEWSKIQSAFAHHFIEDGADRSLSVLSKTIRVPGVPRGTKDGQVFVPTIVYLNPEAEIGAHDCLPDWLADASTQAKKSLAKSDKVASKRLEDYKKGKVVTHPVVFGRNDDLFKSVFKFVCDPSVEHVTMALAIEYGKHINSSFASSPKGMLDDWEVEKTVESAYKAGIQVKAQNLEKAEAAALPPVPYTNGTNGTNGHHATALYAPFQYSYESPGLAHNRFSEIGLSDRIVERFGSQLCRINERVYAFQDGTWELQTLRYHGNLDSMASTAILDIINDPAFVSTFCTTKEGEFSAQLQMKAQMRFMSPRVLNGGISRVLQSKSLLEVSHNTFDNKNTYLLCDNEVIDCSAKEIVPRAPVAEDYLKAKTSVKWDASARCEGWLTFLSEVFEESQELIDFMQELFGYTLSGCMSEQRIFCHYGDGCNGKSKVLYALAYIAGSYGITVPPDDLSKAKGMGKAFERFGAQIEGRRVAIVDDLDVKSVWNESLVKTLTARTIAARQLYSELREIPNRAKLHLGLNVAPVPEAENFGILRRLCFIPYNVQFEPSGHKENELTDMIEREASGILAWSVEGFKRYFKRGQLVYPEATLEATEDYQEENFPLASVLKEMFTAIPQPPKNECGEQSWEHWHWLSDLTEEVNLYLAHKGSKFVGASSPKDLSTALKRAFKVTIKKRFDSQRKAPFRGVFLMKKYDPKSIGKFDHNL